MKLQVFLFLVAFVAVGSAKVIVNDLISHPITWYRNCRDATGEGTIKLIALTNCSTLATCEVRTEEQARLLLTFDAGANYSSLDYILSLRELNGNRSFFELTGNGFETVEEGNEYSLGINFVLSSTIPRNDYNLRLHRFVGSETELCVQFEIYVRNDAPTTLPPSTTTTGEPTTEALTTVSTAATLPTDRTETPGVPTDITDGATTSDSESTTAITSNTKTTSVPEPTTTSIPELTTTSAPEPTKTSAAEPTTTSVPEPTTPSVPEPTTPSVLEPTTPSVPEPTTPNVPEPTTPNVPEPTTTSVPESTTTSAPGTTSPKDPESTTTTTNDPGTWPELTTVDPITSPLTVSTTTKTTTTANPSPGYNCTVPGVFPDPVSCTIFHVCQYFPNGTIWDQQLECPSVLVFCPRIEQCEYESLCPCDKPFL